MSHMPNWQTKTVYPNGQILEIDCNSGRERHLVSSACSCGEKVLIELNAQYSNRRDRKRVFYPDTPDDNTCVFRCRGCHSCVDTTVPGAHYEQEADPTSMSRMENVTVNQHITSLLPKQPPPGLLMSMALRFDHSLADPSLHNTRPIQFGPTHKQKLESTLRVMAQLYEEMSGHGFYAPDRAGMYTKMLNEFGVEEPR